MALGPRVVAELLLEVADRDIDDLLRRLDRYVQLADVVNRLGGADWTPPLRTIIRRRAA
jgi:hypothetical protein